MSSTYNYEYFKNMEHIKDLQKIKDDKLQSIIQEFYKEIKKLNDNKTIKLKDLKKLCDETTEIINIIKNILISYKLKQCLKLSTPNNIIDILDKIKFIELILKDLKKLKINSTKLKFLTEQLLLFIRLLNLLITELNNN